MLDDKSDKAMDEVLKRGAALIDALDLTPVERQYAMEESQRLIKTVTEAYFDDDHLKGRNVRPVAVAAAVAFSLTYFDKWVNEMTRKFPDLGKKPKKVQQPGGKGIVRVAHLPTKRPSSQSKFIVASRWPESHGSHSRDKDMEVP